MKRQLTYMIILALAISLVATPVMAGGDKNRGGVGKGDVEQHQVSWDEYESQRLVQEQVLTQTQEQLKVQVRVRAQAQVQTQWQKSRLASLWF